MNVEPTTLIAKSLVLAVLNTKEPLNMIAVDGALRVCQIDLKKEDLVLAPIPGCRFEVACKSYAASKKASVIWGWGLRDFHTVDLASRAHASTVVSHNGSDMIFGASLFDVESSALLVKIRRSGWTPQESFSTWVRFDYRKDSLSPPLCKYYGGSFHRISPAGFLFQEAKDPPERNLWHLVDNDLKPFAGNKLTNDLTKSGMSTYSQNVSVERRIIIGDIYPGEDGVLATARWDSSFDSVKIQPLTFQLPKEEENKFLEDGFQFSPDGQWLRATSNDISGPRRLSQIVFYHVDDKYPQGLSLPIFGGSTNSSAQGAFMDLPGMGVVYLDITKGLQGVVYAYKMSDVLAAIAARALEMR